MLPVILLFFSGKFMKRTREKKQRQAFTLVELLVVIAIIGILVGLLLPAVQAAREAARRMQCSNNLKQWGLALHNYESAAKKFPARQGGSGHLLAGGQRGVMSGWFALLPYIEQQALYDQINATDDWPATGVAANILMQSRNVPALMCPSDAGETCPVQPARTRALSSYAFCSGDDYASSQAFVDERLDAVASPRKTPINNRGIFGRWYYCSIGAITDGTSNTIALTERQRPSARGGSGGVASLAGTPATITPLQCRAKFIGNQYVPITDVPTGDTSVGYRAWGGNAYFAAATTILPPNSASCFIAQGSASYHLMNGIWTPGSEHTGGVQATFADGSVRFISSNIDAGNQSIVAPAATGGGLSPYGVWGALGTKAAGEVGSSLD